MAKKTAKAPKYKKSPFLKGEITEEALNLDNFQRSEFAKNIADLIKADAHAEKLDSNKNIVPDLSSTVLGLEGDWGSGKSFTLGLIERHFKDPKDGYLWLEFEPWMFRDREHLTNIFLDWLAESLEPNNRSICRSIRKLFAQILIAATPYFKYIFSLSCLLWLYIIILTIIEKSGNMLFWGLIPTPLMLVETVKNSLINNIPDLIRDYAQNQDIAEELKRKRDKIFSALENEQSIKRIIISIEDIDRLTPEEVRTIFRMVKMVANFPKVTYIIPYDRKHVASAINELLSHSPDEAYGHGFVQKVMSASFKLPQVNHTFYVDALFDSLQKRALEVFAERHFQTTYNQHIRLLLYPLVDSMRKVERTYNTALLFLSTLKHTANPTDIIVASYLSAHQPKLWAKLGRDELTTNIQRKDSPTYALSKYNPLSSENEKFNIARQSSSKDIQEYVTSCKESIIGNRIIQNQILALLEGVYQRYGDEKYPLGKQGETNRYFSLTTEHKVDYYGIADSILSARPKEILTVVENIRLADFTSQTSVELLGYLSTSEKLAKNLDTAAKILGIAYDDDYRISWRILNLVCDTLSMNPTQDFTDFIMPVIKTWVDSGSYFLATTILTHPHVYSSYGLHFDTEKAFAEIRRDLESLIENNSLINLIEGKDLAGYVITNIIQLLPEKKSSLKGICVNNPRILFGLLHKFAYKELLIEGHEKTLPKDTTEVLGITKEALGKLSLKHAHQNHYFEENWVKDLYKTLP